MGTLSWQNEVCDVNAAIPFRSDAEPDKATVARIAVFTNNPLIGQIAHEYRHPALVRPRRPRDLVESDTGMLGYLLQQDKTRTGHRKRQSMIPSQLHIVATELSLDTSQQREDVFLGLCPVRNLGVGLGLSRAVRFVRNVHE